MILLQARIQIYEMRFLTFRESSILKLIDVLIKYEDIDSHETFLLIRSYRVVSSLHIRN